MHFTLFNIGREASPFWCTKCREMIIKKTKAIVTVAGVMWNWHNTYFVYIVRHDNLCNIARILLAFNVRWYRICHYILSWLIVNNIRKIEKNCNYSIVKWQLCRTVQFVFVCFLNLIICKFSWYIMGYTCTSYWLMGQFAARNI